MTSFAKHETALSGLVAIDRLPLSDSRGFFCRMYCEETFAQIGWPGSIAQINNTLTTQTGTVRGLHYQLPPHAEDKFVSCIAGAVYDVAVDLRRGSETFLKWHGVILSAENNKSLLIPKGFAHGFQTLQPDCVMLYLHSASYNSSSERGISPDDPLLAIDWPMDFDAISDRDKLHPPLSTDFMGITL